MTNYAAYLDKELLTQDPKSIVRMIDELAVGIEHSKTNLVELKERSFFRKMFKDNIDELTDAVVDQNKLFSVFLNLIQGVILLNGCNAAMLNQIMQELDEVDERSDHKGNQYIKMARGYIQATVTTMNATDAKIEAHERSVERKLRQMRSVSLLSIVFGFAGIRWVCYRWCFDAQRARFP